MSVRSAIYAYPMHGVGDIKRLQGSEFLRLRVGRYRAIFAEDRMTIIAIYFGKRETTTERAHVMGEPQIIRTPSGDEMMVVPRAEYEALLAAADEAQEDAADLAIARRRWQQWNDAGRLTTPPDVALMILDGRHVLEAFRRHQKVSVEELAAKSGIGSALIRGHRRARGDRRRADDVRPRRRPGYRACLADTVVGRVVKSQTLGRSRAFPLRATPPQCARIASNSSATMLVILIAGFTAGPAVSL